MSESKPSCITGSKAELVSFSRGFGGDNYEYKTRNFHYVVVNVGWGLLAGMDTECRVHELLSPDSEVIETHEFGDTERVEAHEALRKLGCEVRPVNPYTLFADG